MLDWESTYIGEPGFSSTEVVKLNDEKYGLRLIAPPSTTRRKEFDPAYAEAASNGEGKIEISLNDNSPSVKDIVQIGNEIASSLHTIIRQYKRSDRWNGLSNTFKKAIHADDTEVEIKITPKAAVITKDHEALFFYELTPKQ